MGRRTLQTPWAHLCCAIPAHLPSPRAEPPKAGTLQQSHLRCPAYTGSSENHAWGCAEQGASTRVPVTFRATIHPRHVAHHRETELLGDLPVVVVPLLHLGLPGRQVAAHEAEAGAVAFPPMPVFTVSIATSLEHRMHTGGGSLAVRKDKRKPALLQRRAGRQPGACGSESV